MKMENDNPRSSTDHGFLKEDLNSVGFQDFDFEDNHVWCEKCKQLKQELKKLQDEHALNYSTLKTKIISTDLLIKKYRAKCDDYDTQTKKHEEFFKKYEELQRESETLNAQLGSTLQQLEPLRKAKTVLEAENKQKQNELHALQNKLIGCELAVKQYEEISRESSTYKDRYEILKKEKSKKIQSLETINQKNELLINKQKEESKSLRTENSLQLRKQRRLEDKLKRIVEKLRRYWGLLRQNGLLPKGDKKPHFDKYLETNGELSVSQDEEDTIVNDEDAADDNDNNDDQSYIQEESSSEIEKFQWIFSPLVQALSPLPPSPMPCKMNKPLMGNESDEENIDEMANLLESELLRSSPIRQSIKSQSVLRKVQTRSPLVECKHKQKSAISHTVTKNVKSSNSNSYPFKSIPNNDEESLSIPNIKGDESLSDADGENIVCDDNRLKMSQESVVFGEKCEVLTYNFNNITEKINEKGDNPGNVADRLSNIMEKSDNGLDHKVERSEHSAFKKIKPKLTSTTSTHFKSGEVQNANLNNSYSKNVCLEAYPVETGFHKERDAMKNINSGISNIKKFTAIKTSTNTSRKIEFVDKLVNNGIENKQESSFSTLSLKTTRKGDDEKIEKGINDEKKDSNDKGFDLDHLFYDNYDTSGISVREVCETPKLNSIDLVNLKDSETLTSDHENARKIVDDKKDVGPHNQNDKKNISGLLPEKNDKTSDANMELSNDRLTRGMIRQISSGFVLRSPPCISGIQDKNKIISVAGDVDNHEIKEVSDKIRGEINSNLLTLTTTEISKKENKLEQTGKVDKILNSVKKLPHQDSMGFKVDSEDDRSRGESSEIINSALSIEVNDYEGKCSPKINKNYEKVGEKQDCIKSPENVHDKTNTINRNDSNISDIIQEKDTINENDLMKQKYLSFVESRRSSQDSVEGRDKLSLDSVQSESSKGDNFGENETFSEKDGENIPFSQTATKVNKKKENKSHCENQMKTTNSEINDIPYTASHKNIPVSKKTLQQLVLHGLKTKTVPSSTVISPEVSDLTMQFDNRPKSRNILLSSSPISPLSVSPFDFSLPILISPLPPSPVKPAESLSPLSGTPLIDDEKVTGPKFKLKKKHSRKKNSNKPCSFSSDVPLHAIHVKPLNSCTIRPTSSKLQERVQEPVPAERDPLAFNKKQRISRVPKQPTSQKRKSLEPIASNITDKKKCKEEKPSTSSQGKAPVKQEMEHWKDVESYMQQYVSLCNMTLEDLKVKLLTDKDPTTVLHAVIVWTTQYLRSSTVDMIQSMYQFCKGDKETEPGPFLTTQENRLVNFCLYIIQNDIWNEFKSRLLDALWNCIMLRDVVTFLGRTSLCRMFTALCQKEGNLEYVRILFYNIMTSGYLKHTTLGLAIVGVWPQVLYKSDTETSDLLTTIELCIMKDLLGDKERYEKTIVCFATLCNWTVPKNIDTRLVLKHLTQELQNVTKLDESNSVMSDKQFELYKSVELLLLTEDLLFKNNFTMTCLNQMFQKIKSNTTVMNGGLPGMYIKHIINLTGTTLARKIENKYATKNIRKFMVGLLNLKTVSMEIQEAVANCMVDVAFITPVPVYFALNEWFKENQKSISPQLKQRMESARIQLVPYEGKLTSYSFK